LLHFTQSQFGPLRLGSLRFSSVLIFMTLFLRGISRRQFDIPSRSFFYPLRYSPILSRHKFLSGFDTFPPSWSCVIQSLSSLLLLFFSCSFFTRILLAGNGSNDGEVLFSLLLAFPDSFSPSVCPPTGAPFSGFRIISESFPS